MQNSITDNQESFSSQFGGGWDWYQRNQSLQAGAVYEQLAKGVAAGDAKAVRDAAGTLLESYPGSLYASMGALASARFLFDRNDLKAAKLQLQWVVDRSKSEEFRDIARLRLAGVLMDEKAYDEALKLLEAKHADAFAAQYALLKGDLLVAKNQAAEAKVAYKLALAVNVEVVMKTPLLAPCASRLPEKFRTWSPPTASRQRLACK